MKDPSSSPGLMTAAQVGKLWGCSSRFVYDLAARGVLPSVRFSRRLVRFHVADVKDFEQRHTDRA